MRKPSLLLSLALGGCQTLPAGGPSAPPAIAGCQILPPNHVFNTPIDSLPVHPNSAAFIATIGAHNLHLDIGTTVDPKSSSNYGIPYIVEHAYSFSWAAIRYYSADTGLSCTSRTTSHSSTR